jgi:predicted exporter
MRSRDNRGVPLFRIAWLVTVLACVLTCVVLLLSGYQGYAAVFLAVGLSAAINLTTRY